MSDPVRNEIVSLLSAVTDIGRVQAYERYASRHNDLADFYADNGQLRGWFVRRIAIKETAPSDGDRRMETVRWRIRGYMALDDDQQTELQFDDLLDAIRTKFRANETLNGVVFDTVIPEQAGIAVDDSGPVMFAGVLCHAARLSLITKRYF